jgi:hypothetical protein
VSAVHRSATGGTGDVHSPPGVMHVAVHRAVPVSSAASCPGGNPGQLPGDRGAGDCALFPGYWSAAAGGKLDIRAGQKLAWENKVAKGFNTTDVPLEFCLLQGEVAEAFDAWRKQRGTVGEELADVALYLFSLAEMTGADLQAEVEAKIEKNAARVYSRLPNGVLVKDPGLGDGILR